MEFLPKLNIIHDSLIPICYLFIVHLPSQMACSVSGKRGSLYGHLQVHVLYLCVPLCFALACTVHLNAAQIKPPVVSGREAGL